MKTKNGVKEPSAGSLIQINIPDVPVEVDEYLRNEAARRDMSKAAVIRTILRDWFARVKSSSTCPPHQSAPEQSISR